MGYGRSDTPLRELQLGAGIAGFGLSLLLALDKLFSFRPRFQLELYWHPSSGLQKNLTLRIVNPNTITPIQGALEKAGVEFIPENGGGPGVRLAEEERQAMSRAKRGSPPSQKNPGYYVCPYCKTGRAVPIAKDQFGQHSYRCSTTSCGRQFSEPALEQADRERRKKD